MGERVLCLVWCEACCNRHWELMNRLSQDGRLASKSGTLKLAVRCESCRTELAAGEEATAFTIDGGPGYGPWEDDYLEIDGEEQAAGDARTGRVP